MALVPCPTSIDHPLIFATLSRLQAYVPWPAVADSLLPDVPTSGWTGSGVLIEQIGPATTVTVNEHVPVFLQSSVALHVTVVVPTGNVLPHGGPQGPGTMPPT